MKKSNSPGPKKAWSGSELKFIRENLKLTDKQIGAELGRTWKSVKSTRERFNILKN